MYQYEHGGAICFQDPTVLDFSANVNPLGLPPGVADAISQAIDQCTVYPDWSSRLLREKIGAFELVSPNQILCTNGASDLIFRLAYALKPLRALVLAPTFSDYERALTAAGCQVDFYFLKKENDFQLDESILSFLEKQYFDVVFLCNPNNPTGVMIPFPLMEKIAILCEKTNCFLVVDECFMGFLAEPQAFTAKPLLINHQNLMIIKAFTKIFALPGLRLGYGLCANNGLIDRLFANSPDWSVSTLAQAAGIAALENPVPYLDQTKTYVEAEKKKLASLFEKSGFTVIGSKANYLFFRSPYDFSLGKILLERHNICIRSCDNYHGLDSHYYRIGLKKQAENQRLVQALQQIIAERNG